MPPAGRPWQVPPAMRCLAYSLLLLATPAFAGKVDPTGPADNAPIKGSVLVWHDAQLLTEPSETAHAMALATFDVPRKDRVGHVVAMKVVSAKGAFIEVELTGDEDCAWSHVVVPDDLARVRMFVRRADLAPVLVKPFTKTFPDGTSISLGAGTPLVATDTGAYVVSMHGDEIEVDVPAAQVGHAYTPARSGSAMVAGQTIAIAAATKAKLGDRGVTLTAWKGAPVEKRGEQAIVAIEDRCVSAHLTVAAKSLTDVDESSIDVDGSSSGGATMSLRDECFLPKGSLLSVGTKQVAVAAKPIYLHAEPMGKNACIQRQIRIEGDLEVKRTDDRLRVCAPATQVAREAMRSARSANGSTRR